MILVGGDWNMSCCMTFPIVGNGIMIPTDELSIIFRRGRSTTNQIVSFPFHIWDVILPIDEVHHFSRWLNHPAVVFYPTLLVLVNFFLGVFGGSRHHLNQTGHKQDV